MASNFAVDPNHLPARTSKRTTVSPLPTAFPSAGISTILNNAQNSNIHNNTFVTNVKADPSLEKIYRRVAPNAILNAGGRADEARCHPGTRDAVIGRIEQWRDGDGPIAPVFWLSGPAGAGKSAIIQTVAERCIQQEVPHANFFFFRSDRSRNTAFPFIATLLYQIILHYPSVLQAVATVLSANPSILNAVLEEQLTQLIVAPLRALQQSSDFYRPLVLLVDGLDECDSQDDQRRILSAFDKVLAERQCPFSLLVGSRDQFQIKTAFEQLLSPVLPLYLSNDFSPERDIRLFVTAEFHKIKETHPLTRMLPANWPSVRDVEDIVQKSSGQFIFAAIVMRFIFHSSANPYLSLQKVKGIVPTAASSPFSHLDAIYTFILSRADDQQGLKDILHAHFCLDQIMNKLYEGKLQLRGINLQALETILSIYDSRYTDSSVIHSCIADLAAIARFEEHRLIFYHASLPEFLLDRSRSGEYYVDIVSLDKRLASNAVLNAGGRADEVRCHPGTREEVIRQIEKWRDARDGATEPILWLSGPAGAGKTAIVQTVAERCIQQEIPQVNFFFFCADISRNTVYPLVATLLYQIIHLYSYPRHPMETRLFNAILEKQLESIIVAPLRAIQQSSDSYQPLVVLVDGLDECDPENKDSQRQILCAFGKVLAEPACPFRLLVASRAESQITASFNQLSLPVLRLYLDETYLPESDIRLFVTDQFAEIKATHHLAPLDQKWPSTSDIDGIVAKSSGRFVYAATIMRFILNSSECPKRSLEIVQGVVQTSTISPFSQLDAFYTYILSRAKDQQAVKDILHAALVLESIDNMFKFDTMLQRVLSTYNCRYTNSDIHSYIVDVTAIVRLERQGLRVYHASLAEYLKDSSRSFEYFVDLRAFGPKILPAIWEHVGKKQGVQFGAQFASDTLISMLPDFMHTIIELEPADFGTFGDVQEMKNVFKIVYDLCARVDDDNMANYKQMIRRWIKHYISLDPGRSRDKVIHDIPCSQRYITMAEIEGNVVEPTPNVADVLRPSSPVDAHEIALWVRDLLHHIHRGYYAHQRTRYMQLIKEWISWAVSNNILLKHLDSLPWARWYFWNCMIQKWANASLNLSMTYNN